MSAEKVRLGPAGNSESFYDCGKKSTIEAPAWVAAMGLSAYEYQAGKGVTGSASHFEQIGVAARENNIAMSLHAPYYISLSSEKEELRIKSLKYIEQSAIACAALGADKMVVHAGSCAKNDRSEALLLMKQTLENIALMMDEKNYQTKIGIETMGKQNQLGTLSEVLECCLVSKKHFIPVVDFGHLNARSGGKLNNPDEFKRIFDEISHTLGAEYAENLHCHFSHIEYTDKGEKKHLCFDDKIFGPRFEFLAAAIVATGVHPTIICESDGTMAEDAVKMKEMLINEYNKEKKKR